MAGKHQRLSPSDVSQLVELLIHKDNELKDTIKVMSWGIGYYILLLYVIVLLHLYFNNYSYIIVSPMFYYMYSTKLQHTSVL